MILFTVQDGVKSTEEAWCGEALADRLGGWQEGCGSQEVQWRVTRRSGSWRTVLFVNAKRTFALQKLHKSVLSKTMAQKVSKYPHETSRFDILITVRSRLIQAPIWTALLSSSMLANEQNQTTSSKNPNQRTLSVELQQACILRWLLAPFVLPNELISHSTLMKGDLLFWKGDIWDSLLRCCKEIKVALRASNEMMTTAATDLIPTFARCQSSFIMGVWQFAEQGKHFQTSLSHFQISRHL